MICPNCKTELTDTRPVITDAEARDVGENRWYKTHHKGFAITVIIGIVGVFVALQLGQFSHLYTFVVGIVAIAASVFSYRQYVIKPMRAAGEQFLKDWRK